jgi:hypothetical protein
MAPVGLEIAVAAVLAIAMLVVIVHREQVQIRLVAGFGLLFLSSIVGIIDEIAGLGVDVELATIALSGAALLVFLSSWLSDEETGQSSPHD